MSRKRVLAFVLLGLVSFVGCSRDAQSVPIPSNVETSPADELKTVLESLAEMGEMFPGSETMEDSIAAIKATDAKKGAALEADFQQLNASLGDPGQVKAKAKEMLEKL